MHLLRQAIGLSALLVIASCAATTHAQTYTPAEIRIDAPPSTDTAEPLRIAALPANASLTKEQIEAALQRIADTGLFSDISYTVNSKALVIKLTPSSSSQSLPVRYGNLVWWKPGELEPLVEARVPIFKGQLPATGTLTDQVEAALVELLQQKGIHAKLTAGLVKDTPDGGLSATNITVQEPRVVLGEVHLQNMPPALSTPLSNFANSLHGEDFDTGDTYASIRLTVADICQNGGYLDASNTSPAYSAPHKVNENYAVDVTTSIASGDIYRVTRLNIQASPPVAQAELIKAAEIKVGAPASPLALRIAHGEIDKAYSEHGYLDVKTTIQTSKDSTAHTVAYDIASTPGEVYHFSDIDTSALTPSQQTAFAHAFHVAPGAIADRALIQAIFLAAAEMHMSKAPSLASTLDRGQHTVAYKLRVPNNGTGH